MKIKKYIKKDEHELGPFEIEIERGSILACLDDLRTVLETLKQQGKPKEEKPSEPPKPVWRNFITCNSSKIIFSDEVITIFRCPRQTFSPPTKELEDLRKRDFPPCDKCPNWEEKKVSHT
jgi:hypothetical protein